MRRQHICSHPAAAGWLEAATPAETAEGQVKWVREKPVVAVADINPVSDYPESVNDPISNHIGYMIDANAASR
jgi:hypothetical protein